MPSSDRNGSKKFDVQDMVQNLASSGRKREQQDQTNERTVCCAEKELQIHRSKGVKLLRENYLLCFFFST
jgi:hypothetical protein